MGSYDSVMCFLNLPWRRGPGEMRKVIVERAQCLFGGDEKVLSMDSGDGYTTFCMYLMALNFIPKMVKMAYFMYIYTYFTII